MAVIWGAANSLLNCATVNGKSTEEGIVSTKQKTFMMILEHKFGEVSDVSAEMVTMVNDVDELDQWLNRALEPV